MSLIGNIIGSRAMREHGNGNYQKAIGLYEEGYKKGMDNPGALKSYSVLLLRLGRIDDALEILKCMEKLPHLTPQNKASMYMNYAIILWKKGHIDRALEILESQLRQRKNGTLYGVIGFIKIETGDAKAALDFNLAALEYDDEDAVVLDNIGQTYYRLLNDKEKAKPYFDKAISIKKDAIDTCYFLALYDIDVGDYISARKHLETAKAGFTSPLNYATPDRIEGKLKEIEGK